MVARKYQEETYSFHLDHLQPSSTTTSLSSMHKQRIDTLFRSKRLQNYQNRSIKSSNNSTCRSVHSTASSRPKSGSVSRQPSSRSSMSSQRDTSLTRVSPKGAEFQKENIRINSPVSEKQIVTVTSDACIRQAPATVIQIHSPPQSPEPKTTHLQRSGTVLHKPTNPVAVQANNHVRFRQQASQNNQAQKELENAFGGKDQRHKAFLDTRSAVQAQIEKLFADATRENTNRLQKTAVQSTSKDVPPPPPPRMTEPPPPPPPSLKTHPALRHANHSHTSPLPPKRNTPSPHSSGSGSASSTMSRTSSLQNSQSSASSGQNSNMTYRVDYLGAIQLSGKATSLDVLQDPLKQLYYAYKLNANQGSRSPTGTLAITGVGLRVVRNTLTKDSIDFTNPFATIAVWAAIKMVVKKKISDNSQVSYSYAFLPLICDPEAQENFNTYYPLNAPDPTIMDGTHPPMFACVMRKITENRILECHGFICRSSEDAIVIAANLYQALLGTMNTSHSNSSNASTNDPGYVMSDSELTPKRPPRRHRSPSPSMNGMLRRANSEDMLRSSTLDSTTSRLRRATSDRHGLGILEEGNEPVSLPNNKLTTVLPRSRSFASVPQALNAHNLFGDPKKKIGLGSIDDVLRAVINPNGMSYSEMDPQHRELLMKMALILTKDEMYRRSKNIMRSHKARSSGFLSGFESDSDASTITSVIKATKRSISRFGSRASNSLRPSYFKERIPLRKLTISESPGIQIKETSDLKETSLKTMSSNQAVDGNLAKRVPKTPMPKRSLPSSGYTTYSECEYDSECSSKCYCTLPGQNRRNINSLQKNLPVMNGLAKKQAACDCDTESCAESERCYCSLKRVKKNGLKMYEINLDSETDTTTTTTTTNNTLKSGNKSQLFSKYNSHLNLSDTGSRTNTLQKNSPKLANSTPQLSDITKQRAVATPNGDLKRQHSICSSVRSRSSLASSAHVSRSNSRLTSAPSQSMRNRARSTESFMETSSGTRRYRHLSGSLGSQGSGNSRGSSSRSSPALDSSDGSADSSQPKILLLSAVDPSGKVVYRNASQRKRARETSSSDTASILSMKKTAEIAALFSELKLNQKTDLIQRLQDQVNVTDSDEDEYETMQDPAFVFSDNIENSLGYLP